MINVDAQEANTDIVLLDTSGNEILNWTAEKTYSSVIISCPEIKEGETYTIKGETVEQSITMDSLVYGSGSPAGGGHGNDGGDRGEMPEDGMRGGPGKGQAPGNMENPPGNTPPTDQTENDSIENGTAEERTDL